MTRYTPMDSVQGKEGKGGEGKQRNRWKGESVNCCFSNLVSSHWIQLLICLLSMNLVTTIFYCCGVNNWIQVLVSVDGWDQILVFLNFMLVNLQYSPPNKATIWFLSKLYEILFIDWNSSLTLFEGEFIFK